MDTETWVVVSSFLALSVISKSLVMGFIASVIVTLIVS